MASHTNACRALLHLCGVIRPEDLRGSESELAHLDAADWGHLVAKATHHGLAGLVSRNLDWVGPRCAVPTQALGQLATLRRRVLTQNLARKAAAREVADALDREGIPYIVLKGIALAEEAYGDLSLRGFNDFDVMVKLEAVEAACRLAQDLGYRLVRFTQVGDWIDAGAHAAGMSRRDGSSVDIHWTIGNALPRDSAAFVWANCVPAPTGASLQGLRLSREMSLVHLAKHFHMGQYGLLKPLVDFNFTARAAPAIDRGSLHRIARALNLVGVVDVAAVVAERRLRTATADTLLDHRPGWPARIAGKLLTDEALVDAADRSRIGNWLRYLASAGGPVHFARGVRSELFPDRLRLAQFFNAPYRLRMYPSYYWRQLVKVLTLSTK